MKRLQHIVEYIIVSLFGILVRLLPLYLSVRIGSFIGDVVFSILGVRKDITLRNIKQAFGDRKTFKEIESIGRECYKNFGIGLVEFLRFPILTMKDVQSLITINGLENINNALSLRRGVVAITGHFGNWELLGAVFSFLGYPVNFLVGEQHNLLVDYRMNYLRRLCGIKIIPMGFSIRKVLEALRKNEIVAMLSDQDAGREGVFVNFFGKEASTPKGPAIFALKTGACILPVFIVREGIVRHRIFIEKPILVKDTDGEPENIIKFTQLYTSILEKYIQWFPNHWFWPHRRWKTSSLGIQSGYLG